MQLKPGLRLVSTACTTEVIVVKGSGHSDLRCGGAPMATRSSADATRVPIDSSMAGGTQIGKRYTSEGDGIELLCTKPGDGTLAIAQDVLPLLEAKPLPASD